VKYALSFIIFLLTGLIVAQTTPVTLPLELQGEGAYFSQDFTAAGIWGVRVLAGRVTRIYLYDSASRENLGEMKNGRLMALSGTFFVYVVTPETTSWRVVVGDAVATTLPLPPVEKRTENNWGRHYGYQVNRFERVAGTPMGDCSVFTSPLEAQNAFMLAGGPANDPNNFDTDGDGYACEFNPTDASYTPLISCETGSIWTNPRWRKDGTYSPGSCREVSNSLTQ
jgi:hypothetical protein